MKQSKAAIVHTVFVAIFLVAAAISAVYLAIMDIEILRLLSLPEADGSDGFGQGLGIGIGAVLIIIFSISTSVISLVGAIISGTAVKMRFGGVKVFAVIALILEIIFIALSVTSVCFVAFGV